MAWNWNLPDWPRFRCDFGEISEQEKNFLLSLGSSFAYIKSIEKTEYHQFIVEVLSEEGVESSRIEGEILDRESLQSSIKKHLGLKAPVKKGSYKESGMADLLCSVYDSYDQPLTSEMLFNWHKSLFGGQSYISDYGKYRTHIEPMLIVSHRFGDPRIFFEAPPSINVPHEMETFINWFNSDSNSDAILGKAAIAHVYFESIHPFEDGNGRIGRALSEKLLSKSVKRPVLIAISKVLEKRKKEYYLALEKCNRNLDVTDFVKFFASVVLQAQEESSRLLWFLIKKAKILSAFIGKLNPRQEKVLLRIFEEGVSGFKGGLSAENYISITKTSKATATRDLNDLVQKGALLKSGELRYTRYHLDLDESRI
jgi:Fic family protein